MYLVINHLLKTVARSHLKTVASCRDFFVKYVISIQITIFVLKYQLL